MRNANLLVLTVLLAGCGGGVPQSEVDELNKQVATLQKQVKRLKQKVMDGSQPDSTTENDSGRQHVSAPILQWEYLTLHPPVLGPSVTVMRGGKKPVTLPLKTLARGLKATGDDMAAVLDALGQLAACG